jgi:hypothetical protein
MQKGLCFSTFVLLAFAAAGFQLVLTNSVAAVDVTIGWDPNSEAELSGYGVYYQKNPPNPPYLLFSYVTLAELADPSNPTMTVTGLDTSALYQFAVTAFDNADNESCFSSPVCVEGNNVKVAVPCPTGAGGGSNGGGSGGGSGCFIRAVSGRYKTGIEKVVDASGNPRY